MTGKKRAIGMVLVGEDDHGRYSLHRIRGKINPEKGTPESFPGATQPFIHGGVDREHQESFFNALARETREELKEMFREIGKEIPAELDNRPLVTRNDIHVLVRKNSQEQTTVTVMRIINDERRALLQALVTGNVVRILRESDVAQIITINPKDMNQRNNGFSQEAIAMFSDNLNAVQKIFERKSDPCG